LWVYTQISASHAYHMHPMRIQNKMHMDLFVATAHYIHTPTHRARARTHTHTHTHLLAHRITSTTRTSSTGHTNRRRHIHRRRRRKCAPLQTLWSVKFSSSADEYSSFPHATRDPGRKKRRPSPRLRSPSSPRKPPLPLPSHTTHRRNVNPPRARRSGSTGARHRHTRASPSPSNACPRASLLPSWCATTTPSPGNVALVH